MKYNTLAAVTVVAVATSACASASGYRNADYRYDDEYRGAEYTSSSTSFTDEARVLRAKPVYDTVTVNKPETQCWTEQVRHQYRQPTKDASYTPTIAGAILGGVVGNQFGGGSGKDVMTAAGMVLGGASGNDYRKTSSGGTGSYTTNERRCETVDKYHETTELVGYNVKYEYQGRNYWTRMDSDPGDYIKVRVSVEPLE